MTDDSHHMSGLMNISTSWMINDLEKRGIIKTLEVTSENKEFYIDPRSFIILKSMGIKELEEYVSSKDEIYVDSLGTKFCSDIRGLVEKLWSMTNPTPPPKDLRKI